MLKDIFGNMLIYGLIAMVFVALLMFLESKKVHKVVEGLLNIIIPISITAILVGLCGYVAMEHL